MLKSLLNDSRAIWQTVSGLQKRVTELEIEIYKLKNNGSLKGIARAEKNNLKKF